MRLKDWRMVAERLKAEKASYFDFTLLRQFSSERYDTFHFCKLSFWRNWIRNVSDVSGPQQKIVHFRASRVKPDFGKEKPTLLIQRLFISLFLHTEQTSVKEADPLTYWDFKHYLIKAQSKAILSLLRLMKMKNYISCVTFLIAQVVY